MKTHLALLTSMVVATAFASDETADEIRKLKLQMQMDAANNRSMNTQPQQVQTGNVPISQMTDIGALMALADSAPVQGKNAALGASIRRQVKERIRQLQSAEAAPSEVAPASGANQPKFSESKLPPKKPTAVPSAPVAAPAQLMLLDGASGTLVPYNDMNLATLAAADAQLSQEQREANSAKAEAFVLAAYPCAKIEGHPIHAKAEEIYAALEKMNSPIFTLSTAPWIVYQQAAQQLGIVSQLK